MIARHRRGLTLGVRAVVVEGEKSVFLIKHSYVQGWHFPGGGVEPRESIGNALARELEEEGGIELTGPAELFGLYHQRLYPARDHVAVYVCRDWRKSRELTLPNYEIVDAGFFPRDGLPEGTTASTRRRLAEIFEGAPPTVEW